MSYLIGCGQSGEALVVDPNRDVEQYIKAADRSGLKIIAVTETHIHADFLSGVRELAQRTGAKPYLSDAGDRDWKYTWAGPANAGLLNEGSQLRIGNIKIEALHTPGHTPEHLSFMVTDGAVADSPMGVVTGDFLFVGDVGRPDLLEKAARVQGASERSAKDQFASVQRFRSMPDHLQVWPGHGAGSACGKAMSAVPQSTIGYEKLFNWAFQIPEEAEFVRQVLSGQPDPPRYFGEMKRLNKLGPAILGGMRRPARLPETRLRPLLRDGALVVDLRSAADFAGRHAPGSINIPFNRSFTGWAGWLLPYDRDFYLIVDESTTAPVDAAVRDLALIGLDRIGGYFGSEALVAWEETEGPLETVAQVGVEALARSRNGRIVLDVRDDSEWAGGHLPGARHIPLGRLPDRLDEIPRDGDLVVHCQSGSRSSIAASLLLAGGFTHLANLTPGYAGWLSAGMPVERSSTP
ncbi:MAG TPA: MBL fold metallo-hydrolase [Gemmatimonadales bacterium]|nr:MBL fold metallo-hydrolase [Gemmatimonadales bacterium]